MTRIAIPALLAFAASGCYVAHARPLVTDAGPDRTSDAAPCAELGPVLCLIDRPCWCWISGDVVTGDPLARCRTCAEACAADAEAAGADGSECFLVRQGGAPF